MLNTGIKPAAEQTVLRSIEINDLPVTNPIVRLSDTYARLRARSEEAELPHLHDFLQIVDEDLMHYCLILLPISGDPFLDFQVLHRGNRIPGSDLSAFKYGEVYTEHILSTFANERLLELASCLALKSCRFSATLSARQSSLKISVYRAVLPVWLADHQICGIILAIAPAVC